MYDLQHECLQLVRSMNWCDIHNWFYEEECHAAPLSHFPTRTVWEMCKDWQYYLENLGLNKVKVKDSRLTVLSGIWHGDRITQKSYEEIMVGGKIWSLSSFELLLKRGLCIIPD